MKQLGVFYQMNAQLPHFSLFQKLREGDTFSDVRSQLDESGFHALSSDREQGAFAYISDIEDQFLQTFEELVEGDAFLETLLWLKRHMPSLRLQLRNNLLKGAGADVRALEIGELCSTHLKAQEQFVTFVGRSQDWSGYTLFTLEKDIDELYLSILRSSLEGKSGAYKEYVHILDEQNSQDAQFRTQYETAGAKILESETGSSALFQELSNEECRFVNRAVIEFDPDLIALQCYVTHMYLFYDARIVASVPAKDRGDMLVNYSIQA